MPKKNVGKKTYEEITVNIKTYSRDEYLNLIEFLAKSSFDITINPEGKEVDR
tara:strand:+ start:89 stop:244 length:156 start_codon:yes stop_codon:yes gene_type:complete